MSPLRCGISCDWCRFIRLASAHPSSSPTVHLALMMPEKANDHPNWQLNLHHLCVRPRDASPRKLTNTTKAALSKYGAIVPNICVHIVCHKFGVVPASIIDVLKHLKTCDEVVSIRHYVLGVFQIPKTNSSDIWSDSRRERTGHCWWEWCFIPDCFLGAMR